LLPNTAMQLSNVAFPGALEEEPHNEDL